MEKVFTVIKGTVVLICAGISSWLGNLTLPIFLLLASMILDYITGIMAAKNRDEVIDSAKGQKGIFKKLSQGALVVVGIIADEIISFGAVTLGMSFPFPGIMAITIALWLLANELISITENVADIGGPIPSWLLPVLKRFKSQVDQAAGGEEDGD